MACVIASKRKSNLACSAGSMGDASGRKDKGTLHIDGCAFLSVFLCWLGGIEAQPTAALSRSGLVAMATQWQALTGTGL
jgi:hypothetical protein